MSVIVRGMEMPPTCQDCPFINSSWGTDYYCGVAKDYTDFTNMIRERMPNCPLHPLPSEHGELIDRDALIEKAFFDYDETTHEYKNSRVVWEDDIYDAPTIVDAERSGE